MKISLTTRIMLLASGVMLVVAPFLSFVSIDLDGWHLQLPGLFLRGSLVLLAGALVIAGSLRKQPVPLGAVLATALAGVALLLDYFRVIARTGYWLGKLWLATASWRDSLQMVGVSLPFEVGPENISAVNYWGWGFVLAVLATSLLLLATGKLLFEVKGQLLGGKFPMSWPQALLWPFFCRCSCGAVVNGQQAYCQNCGQAVSVGLFCKQCGHPAQVGDKFCRHCSRPLPLPPG